MEPRRINLEPKDGEVIVTLKNGDETKRRVNEFNLISKIGISSNGEEVDIDFGDGKKPRCYYNERKSEMNCTMR